MIVAVAMLAGARIAVADLPTSAVADSPVQRQVKPLDLRAPAIAKLYTPGQIETLLAKMERDRLEVIEVERTRERLPSATPEVWGGIAAPFWALLHPTQAWRVFAPLPPDRARSVNATPDATSPYRDPISPRSDTAGRLGALALRL